MNGAGESAPSNNVTIPSLPDIAPVTASLRHQVWKSEGETMVNVSFEVSYSNILVKINNIILQPATSCMEYPVLSYLLALRSVQTGTVIYVFNDSNETEIVLGHQDGLEENQKYVYKVTAINSIGNVTSHKKHLGLYTHFTQLHN